jgi:hypothetical protein
MKPIGFPEALTKRPRAGRLRLKLVPFWTMKMAS